MDDQTRKEIEKAIRDLLHAVRSFGSVTIFSQMIYLENLIRQLDQEGRL